MIKTIIVDDEWLIRSELTAMLTSYPEIVVVGEAANTAAARQLVNTTHPDLIFLDIQMPGENGFQLLDTVDKNRVIFISAYDHYLQQSKDLHPLGFLLKPIHPQKMDRLLRRVFPNLSRGPNPSQDKG